MIKVGIIGATGYAGQQLVWILNNHKEVEIKFISSYSNAGENIGEVYKNYIFDILILDYFSAIIDLSKNKLKW